MSTRHLIACAALAATLQGCSLMPPSPSTLDGTSVAPAIPAEFPAGAEAQNSASLAWRDFFDDPHLAALIDTALANNQEMSILLQEIEISKSEVTARTGEYLPSVRLRGGIGIDKVGEYTREGAVEENLEVAPDKEFPEPLADFKLAAELSWEVDIWNKLRNAKKAAVLRYLATGEGRNFMVTRLVAEIAASYYELIALDRRLAILDKTIEIQRQALETVRLQKAAAKATELAVRRFEAEVAKNRSRIYSLRQQVVETENRINYLAGRYPQPVERSVEGFEDKEPASVHLGAPADLLVRRPDVVQAELELAATQFDVQSARARFFPSLDISAAVGLQSFSAGSFATTPESLLYNLAADVLMPLINRKALEAAYASATAAQLQAVYRYQQAALKAYMEVLNQLARIDNLGHRFSLKRDQVTALSDATDIAGLMFTSARADYLEVLLTQREAQESKLELVEIRLMQMDAMVKMYQALGGGYQPGGPAEG
ncbi:MAG: efflux transporter outer membrane subunit [Gammaproteobacteria bacterium]